MNWLVIAEQLFAYAWFTAVFVVLVLIYLRSGQRARKTEQALIDIGTRNADSAQKASAAASLEAENNARIITLLEAERARKDTEGA